jgi:hypothetical protein
MFAVGCSVTHFHFCQFFHNNVDFINISGHNICSSNAGIQADLFFVFLSPLTAHTVRTFNNIVFVMYIRAILADNHDLCAWCLRLFALQVYPAFCCWRFPCNIP